MEKVTTKQFEEKTTNIINYIKNEMIRDKDIEIDANTPLISSGLIDSLSIVEFVLFLETTFNIEIPLIKMEVENFESLAILSNKLKKI
jgi:acyl carrier protein